MERLEFAEGSFAFDEPASGVGPRYEASSGAKWAYRGRYIPYGDGAGPRAEVPAIAVFSCRNNETCLKREMAALGQGEHAGFGPRLLANAEAARPDDPAGQSLAFAVEEDAGVSLAHVLAARGGAVSLADPTSPDGRRQTAKILFDVTCQVMNMHRCGLFHHDIKAANICVRRIGERPWDLRTTLIDFDHAMHRSDGLSVLSTPAYYDLLFADVTAGGQPCVPDSLVRDLGCLAVVWCEVTLRRELRYSRLSGAYSITRDDISHVLDKDSPFFWYDGAPFARKLDFYTDLEPFAHLAGLVHADELALPYDVQREASLFKCGAYFDAESVRDIPRVHEQNLGRMEDSIARAVFENYNRHVEQDGGKVRFERFEAQPPESRYSNYAQAAAFVAGLWKLGYELVDASRCAPEQLVGSFGDDEVDLLARWEHERWMDERTGAGWTFGETDDGRSDFARRVSPSLVPYDELPEAMRAYDCRPMAEMLDILRERGLGVRRRAW